MFTATFFLRMRAIGSLVQVLPGIPHMTLLFESRSLMITAVFGGLGKPD